MPDNFSELARAAKSASVDAASLAADLRRRIRGEVRFDDGSRALYATDGSNYRQVPIGVVVPRTRSEEHTSELQSRQYLVCRLLLEKKKKPKREHHPNLIK